MTTNLLNPAAVLGLPMPAVSGDAFRFRPLVDASGFAIADMEMPPDLLARLDSTVDLGLACRAAIWLSIMSPVDAAHTLGLFDSENGPGRRPGSFYTHLFRAAAAADNQNAAQLAIAFPGPVAAVLCWQNVPGSPELLAARARMDS